MIRQLIVLVKRFFIRDARFQLILQLPRVSTLLTFLLSISIVSGVFLSMGFLLASSTLIGTLPQWLREGGFHSPARWYMAEELASVITLFAVYRMLMPFRDVLTNTLGRRLETYLQERTMRAALMPAGLVHLEDPANADLVTMARGMILGQYTPAQVLRGLVNLYSLRLQTITNAVLLAYATSWWLALGFVLILIIASTGIQRHLTEIAESTFGANRPFRRSEYFLELALKPQAAKETRIYGLANWIVERFQSHWFRTMIQVWRKRQVRTRAIAPWVIVVVFITNFTAFAFIICAAIRGNLSLTSVVLSSQAIVRLTLNLLSFNSTELANAYGASVVPAVLELEQRTLEAKQPVAQDPNGLPVQEIRFEEVSFAYPGGEKVLDKLNLVIPAGRSFAIVGTNGAGKTTLIKLLARLYEPTSGRITVDATDVANFHIELWRKRLSVIFQDFVHYELSVADNVRFGAVEKNDNSTLITTALQSVGADTFVTRLPHGVDTILSPRYTGGTELSGGQWQRIALARALYAVYAGASILILDEPTASLDARAEIELFNRFLDLTRGLTTVLISHRFSTVRKADQICVLEDGHMIEQGTHEELLATNGRYASMYSLQAERFTEGTVTTDDRREL